MRPYLAILAARFRTLLQYRAAAAGGVFTQSFFGLMRIMILEAFYRSTAQTQPLSMAQMIGYVWLGQATFAMFAVEHRPGRARVGAHRQRRLRALPPARPVRPVVQPHPGLAHRPDAACASSRWPSWPW